MKNLECNFAKKNFAELKKMCARACTALTRAAIYERSIWEQEPQLVRKYRFPQRQRENEVWRSAGSLAD